MFPVGLKRIVDGRTYRESIHGLIVIGHHAAEVRDMAINVSRAPPNVSTSSGGGYFPPNVTHSIEIDGNEVQCPGAGNIGNAFAIILDNRE